MQNHIPRKIKSKCVNRLEFNLLEKLPQNVFINIILSIYLYIHNINLSIHTYYNNTVRQKLNKNFST